MSDLTGPATLDTAASAGAPPRPDAALAEAAARVAPLAILVLAALARGWNMAGSGFGQLYYSAGVRSMMANFHNFFFNAFDPAGFVSLDKPPVAIWSQVITSEIVGFGPVGVHLPQMLEGVASVWLLHRLVSRRFGALAGLLSALFLALMPISVAVDRSTNTDSCLVLALLFAAWALLRAADRASQGWLVLAMALVGLAFNVKMLAAFVVLPAFCGVYLLMAPTSLARRLRHLAVAAPVLVAVSLAWVGAFDLAPAADRPYAGSSAHNSMLELAVIHNGLQRFVAPGRGGGREAVRADGAPAVGGGGGGSRVPAGPFRLLNPTLATQFAWLLPIAVIGCAVIVFGAWSGGARDLRLAGRRLGRSIGPRGRMLALFGGWAATYAVVLSAAAGIFHAYYIVAMAPPMAALAGIGADRLWRSWRAADRFQTGLATAIGGTALWQIWIGSAELIPVDDAIDAPRLALLALLIGGAMAAAAALLVLTNRTPRLGAGAFALGMLAMLVLPGGWTIATVAWAGGRPDPLARLSPPQARPAGPAWAGAGAGAAGAGAGAGQGFEIRRLVAFTRTNNSGETFLFATPTTRLAAPVIIASGEPVMAMGGFSGSDPIVTPASLGAMVARGDLRFVLFRHDGFGRGAAAASRADALEDWIGAHGALVDPALWNAPGPATNFSVRRGQPPPRPVFHLYDLRPELGIVALRDGA